MDLLRRDRDWSNTSTNSEGRRKLTKFRRWKGYLHWESAQSCSGIPVLQHRFTSECRPKKTKGLDMPQHCTILSNEGIFLNKKVSSSSSKVVSSVDSKAPVNIAVLGLSTLAVISINQESGWKGTCSAPKWSHCDSQTQPNIHSQPNKCPTSQMCLYVSLRHSSGWNSKKAYLKQCPPTVVPRTNHEYNTAQLSKLTITRDRHWNTE